MPCGITTPELPNIRIDGIVRPVEDFINLKHVTRPESGARVEGQICRT
jgi:hypothetical protein